jgi:transposase
MKPYSNDLRRKIVAAYENNDYSQSQVAQLFGVSPATVRNLVRRKRETGTTDALPHAGGKSPTLGEKDHELVRQVVKANSDATLVELCYRVEQEHKKGISTSSMCRLLRRLGLGRKKRPSTPLNETCPEWRGRGRTGGR